METSDWIKIILTSTLVATIFATIISTIVSIRLKYIDFKNEYYKKVIRKRLNAYHYLETQISVLKNIVLDEDDLKPYHEMFNYGPDEFYDYQKNLKFAQSLSLWIDQKTSDKMDNLNDLFLKISLKFQEDTADNIREYGKNHYKEISKIRNDLEIMMKKDLYNLHKLRKFFKKQLKNTNRLIEVI